jgi:hypothetical protein
MPLTLTPDKSQIMEAYKIKVMLGHPDHGGNADMDELKAAKDLLIKTLTIPQKEVPAGSSKPCGFCGGRGTYNNGRFGELLCPACNGTGER